MSAIAADASGNHKRELSFTMQDGSEVSVQIERTSTPPPSQRLQEAFTTPPPRSVPMERTPPSPYRTLCLDCAERARDFYDRSHADHALRVAMARYTHHGDMVPRAPLPLQAHEVNAFNKHISRPPSPPTPKASWADPYDGVM